MNIQSKVYRPYNSFKKVYKTFDNEERLKKVKKKPFVF